MTNTMKPDTVTCSCGIENKVVEGIFGCWSCGKALPAMKPDQVAEWRQDNWYYFFIERLSATDRFDLENFITNAIKSETDRRLREVLGKYENIFKWLSGEEGDFPSCPSNAKYCWRTELRNRLEDIPK